jgi:transketolase
VKLVGFMPERLSDGILNPAIDDVAAMRAIPAMQVFCPADRDELVEALPEILASRAPAYIRYTSAPAAVEHLVPFSIGKAEVLSHEEGVSILTYGPLLHVADRARRALQERGVPVHLVNLRTLEPVDEEAIVDAVRPAELVVTLEDHFRRGGLYTILAETCLEHRLAPRVLGLDSWPLVTDDDVLRHERLSGARVAERILHALCRA